jgi:hypothetical protein
MPFNAVEQKESRAQMTQVCTICGMTLELDRFYVCKRKTKSPYRYGFCVSCQSEKAREWQKRNPEKREEIWRRHAENNRAAYAEANRRYAANNPERYKKSQMDYRLADPQKRIARNAVAAAIRSGALKSLPCEGCGSTTKIQAHHHDYSKPLDVKWLCSLCHGKVHSRAGLDQHLSGYQRRQEPPIISPY